MKYLKFLIWIILLVIIQNTGLFAQWQTRLAEKDNNQQQPYTLNELRNAFNEYWTPYKVENGYYYDNGIKVKASGWKQFKRSEWLWEQRVNPVSGEFPSTSSLIEIEKNQMSLKKTSGKASTANWTNLGTTNSLGGYAGIGRINCVAFHPTDVNTYWVGAGAGGIWKTTDNGSSWTILNNSMSVLGISDIAIPSDFATSNTIYIATGDKNGNSLADAGKVADNHSLGVYKSTNGGTTWTATGLTFLTAPGSRISRLLIASDNTTLFAATTDGIYKSTNSAASWSLVLDTTIPGYLAKVYVIDMEFKPGDNNTIYASTATPFTSITPNVIYRTTNGGTNWSTVFTGTTGAGSNNRIEMTVTAADPSFVYAVVSFNNPAGGTPLKGIYKSTNSGANFSLVYDGILPNQNLLGYNFDANDMTAGQGGYDLTIAASPTDKNTIFVGGINTWYSTNGGTSWVMKTIWSNNTNPNNVQIVHADKHFLAFQNSTVLFECGDGGIYRGTLTNSNWSDPGSNFVDKTNGLSISQLYRLGVSKSDVTKVITGLQDNGSKLYNSGVWSDATGGDGMECIIDHTNPLYMYATYTNGTIYRNENGFSTQATTTISGNIPGGQSSGAWVTPYIMNPTNSSILYAGFDRVWKTTDRGDTWTSISDVLSATTKLRSLAIAPSNFDVMYSADLNDIWKTTNAQAVSPVWTNIKSTLPNDISITYIAVKANDPSTLWVTFGGYTEGNKIFQSTDGGTTWTNISGTLPNIPVLSVVQYTRAASTQLFIGTDAGVYTKDGNNDWSYFNDGMPVTVVPEIEFYYGANQSQDRLRAATFSRGLWETPMQSTGATAPSSPTSLAASTTSASQINLTWQDNASDETGYKIERKLTLAGAWTTITTTNANITSFSNTSLTDGTKYYYRVYAFNTNGNSNFSNEVNSITTMLAPANLSAQTVTSQVVLNWADNSQSEDGYTIERKEGQTGQFAKITDVNSNATTYTDAVVAAGLQYFYRVRGFNANINSSYSNEANVTIVGSPVASPTSLAAVSSSSQINLTWQDNSNDETGFKIDRRLSPTDTWTTITTTNANVTSYSNTSLTDGTKYYYRVYAFNANGNSTFSNEVNAVTTMLAPANLSAQTVTSQVVLNWIDNSQSEDGYTIERRQGSTGQFVKISEVNRNVSTYTETPLNDGTKYYYKVYAFNTNGNSTFSNEVNIVTTMLAPTNLSAQTVTSQVVLNWTDNSQGEDGYTVERKEGSAGTFAKMTDVNSNVTTYTDATVTAGHQYIYRVRGFNANINSSYSNEASVTITDVNSEAAIPTSFALYQNYPNPFNPSTIIKFAIPKESTVRLIVYDINGKLVTTLLNEVKSAGYYNVIWTGIDKSGKSISSGIYIYAMESDGFRDSKKMLFIK